MSVVATSDGHALPPAAPAPRRHVAMVGTIFAIAAGAMLIGGLLAAYFGAREVVQDGGGTWVDATKLHLPNMALAMTYLSLFMSSFTAQWAVSAIKLDDRRQAYVAMGLTLVLATAFLNGMTFCWAQIGAQAGDGAFADHMYAVTAVHVLLVVVAIVFFAVMAFRALGGHFSPKNAEFVAAAVAFWHFVVVAGVVVWWCIWFLEGGPN
jgi:heme/copper-type cytochrome/quinol oxidase subunit 3